MLAAVAALAAVGGLMLFTGFLALPGAALLLFACVCAVQGTWNLLWESLERLADWWFEGRS